MGTSIEYVQFGIPDAGLQTVSEATRKQIELGSAILLAFAYLPHGEKKRHFF